MVGRLKQEVVPPFLNETSPQSSNFLFELVCSEDLVRQCRERQIKVVLQLAVCKFLRLGKTVPDALEIGGQCSLEVGQRCGADVVTNDEKK